MSLAEKYTKKPITIEAVQFDGTEESVAAVLKFMQGDNPDLSHLPNPDGYVEPGVGYTPACGELHIPTLEGTLTASPGDWIIKGVNGEFYPCKPDIFEATYTLAK